MRWLKMSSSINRYKFVHECFKLRQDIRFQNIKIGMKHVLFNQIPSFAWNINKQFLRYSIENSHLTELIYDIDAKNEKGEKKLHLAIDIGLHIYDKLKGIGFKPSFYYSGGNGIHIHTLINLNSLDFLKYNNIEIDLNEYEKEFRFSHDEKKKQHTPNLDLIDNRNEERRLVKKWIAEFFEIKGLVDNMLFSTKEMITSEGYQKRNSKTGNYKIWIDIENVHEREAEILRYIDENKHKIIINENYFNEVSILNYTLTKYLKEQYKTYTRIQEEREPKSEPFISADRYKSSQIESGGLNKSSPKVINQFLITYAYILKKNKIYSTNHYYNIVIAHLYSATGFNYEETLKYFNQFFDVFKVPDNLSCSREQKVKSVIDMKQKYSKYAIFTENNYLTKEEFWDNYFSLFPKNNSFSGHNGLSNNELNKQEVITNV